MSPNVKHNVCHLLSSFCFHTYRRSKASLCVSESLWWDHGGQLGDSDAAAVMLTQQLTTPGTRRTRTHQQHQDKSSPSLISELNMVESISVRPRTHKDVVRPPSIWLLEQVILALWLLQPTPPPPPFHCTRTLNHQYSGFPDVSQLYIKPIILHMNNTDWPTASPGKLSIEVVSWESWSTWHKN